MTATINEHQIEQAMGGAHRYWMADGIVEIVLGGFWLIWGAVVILPILAPDPRLAQLRIVALLVSMGAMPLLLRRLIRGWKERVSFPRTGYVEFRRPRRVKILIFVPIAGFLAFVVSLLGSHGSLTDRQWTALGLGVLMFLAMLVSAWRMRAPRLLALSWLVLAAAIASFEFRAGFALSSAILLLAYACVFLSDGLLRLRSYLKAHPAAGEES